MKNSLSVKNKLYLSLVMVVLLALVAWTTRAQGQSSNPVRQAWESRSSMTKQTWLGL